MPPSIRMMISDFIRPDWPAPAQVRALVTTRQLPGISRAPFDHLNLGAHCGDEPGAVDHNRGRLFELAGLPHAPHWLAQVHGTHVQRVDDPMPAPGAPQADAAVTRVPGAVLAILTADCLPVLLSSRDGSEVAAAHAGWRGLAAGVLESTVAAMRTAPDGILAWLGPAAGPDHYEIGDEVRAALLMHDPEAAACFQATRAGHWLVDLYALARRRLARLGIQRVDGGSFCTISDSKRFYSHRRDGRSGRMASLIWLQACAGHP